MYSVEYKCTRHETPVTTINIKAVTLSKRNPQPAVNKSELNQGASFM
jgi:hypothetical protein